ncbi:short-chain dehydrogenase/reductase [Mycobacterium sp. 1274756.6]|uniref:short-chain dehydrogenase/reductase n=1 Tax=Mycobacterium sp. 1274756.6 TaxID=1834076 RepID=UPI0007FEC041|nr:short-chain dehydrogenase/reductase [Mycobacterium sp. 1274756.6]OBJ69094.1 short-chain dehydrogenase [Mycobacterium sp. 1274756.6]
MSGRDMRGKVALVTGAGQGIGRAVAAELGGRGVSVALVDRAADRLRAAVADLPQAQALAAVADVTDPATLRRAVAETVDTFGRLDYLVANAGIAPPVATVRGGDDAAFNHVLDVNLRGVYNTVRAGLEPVIAAGGHIEVISSGAAFAPGPGGAAYMVSKAGVEQLARALRLECAPHRVSVGTTYFGIVQTAMTRATLDEHPLGAQVSALLPWPLSRRISAAQAAAAVADALQHRRSQTFRPRAWAGYALLRGVLNAVVDPVLVRSPRIHRLIRELDGG